MFVGRYVSTVAVMFSDKRGKVAQFDMEQVWACIWRAELSAEGRYVMDRYVCVKGGPADYSLLWRETNGVTSVGVVRGVHECGTTFDEYSTMLFVGRYMDVGMNLETLTFARNDSFTLYFPSGSG